MCKPPCETGQASEILCSEYGTFDARLKANDSVLKSERASFRPRNIAGPRIRQLRNEAGLSQADLAARCGLQGWDLSRETLAKIESQIRWVADFELLCLASALSVDVKALLPAPKKTKVSMADWF
ncbi:MAG TPA: hypothetical protein DIT64_22405 [Verrucomicrobiales bacterium]|nr:hypothetical protein [Verrucomicrobiales bacterium]